MCKQLTQNKLLLGELSEQVPHCLQFCLHHYLSLVMRKLVICICENKDADELRNNREADQRLCFRYRLVQYLYFIYPKFQASCYLLWLYSLVCVGPCRKPRRPVFSQRGSFDGITFMAKVLLPRILEELH